MTFDEIRERALLYIPDREPNDDGVPQAVDRAVASALLAALGERYAGAWIDQCEYASLAHPGTVAVRQLRHAVGFCATLPAVIERFGTIGAAQRRGAVTAALATGASLTRGEYEALRRQVGPSAAQT